MAICSIAAAEKNEADDEATRQNQVKLSIRAQKMLLEGEGSRRNDMANPQSSLIVSCPLCENKSKFYNITQSNTDISIDRDFCRHSHQKGALDFKIWLCTHCGYSNHKSFFTTKPELTEDEQKELNGRLIAFFIQQFGINISKLGHRVGQEDVPSHIKYAQMLSILDKLDLPWKAKADFHLNYAWIERHRLCAAIVHPGLSTTISSINKKLATYAKHRKEKNISAHPNKLLDFIYDQQKNSPDELYSFLLLIYEAEQLNRLGYTPKATEALKKAILMEQPAPYKNIAQFKYQVHQNEIHHLRESVVCIKNAIKEEQYDQNELPSTIYLLGELQRRIGLIPEAIAWLDTASQLQDKNIAQWAKEQRLSLPKKHGLVPDSESILIQKALRDLNKLKDQTVATFDPSDVTSEKAERWLREIHLAATHYHRQYRLDPENLQELFSLGFLKGQPDLVAEALRFFKISVQKSAPASSLRYNIECLLPFSEGNQYYLYSYINGQVKKIESTF